jgi:hypothetical protein
MMTPSVGTSALNTARAAPPLFDRVFDAAWPITGSPFTGRTSMLTPTPPPFDGIPPDHPDDPTPPSTMLSMATVTLHNTPPTSPVRSRDSVFGSAADVARAAAIVAASEVPMQTPSTPPFSSRYDNGEQFPMGGDGLDILSGDIDGVGDETSQQWSRNTVAPWFATEMLPPCTLDAGGPCDIPAASWSAHSSIEDVNTELAEMVRLNFADVWNLSLPPLVSDGTAETGPDHVTVAVAVTQTNATNTATAAPPISSSPEPSAVVVQKRCRRSRSAAPKATGRAGTSSAAATAGKSAGSRAHQDTKYACPYCEKILTTKYKMQRHVRTHTGEKPFGCDACPARFNQKSSRKTHSHIHAKAFMRVRGHTEEMVENYTVNGYTLEDLGRPYPVGAYTKIHRIGV